MSLSPDSQPCELAPLSADEAGVIDSGSHLDEITLVQRENRALRQQVGYWKSVAERRALEIAALNQTIEEFKIQINDLNKRLFGKHSEKSKGSGSGSEKTKPTSTRKKRGQQRGRPGHGRKIRSALPKEDVIHDVAEEDKVCKSCGKPFEPFPGDEESEELDIDIKVVRKVHRRKRYHRTCKCDGTPGIIAAPRPAKLIPKGLFSVRFWTYFLIEKYFLQRPMTRTLTQLESYGLEVSPGTVVGGLKRLAPLFKPLYEALIEESRRATHWHADETGWRVFVEVKGKSGYRWQLWVFSTPKAVVFYLDPSRSKKVPVEHFQLEIDDSGKVHATDKSSSGILSVDRYSVYKALGSGFRLAFCWAHQRRDFLKVAIEGTPLKDWALNWVESINELYALNDRRLELAEGTPERQDSQKNLEQAVKAMKEKLASELNETSQKPARRKILQSLTNHWVGYTLFVDNPQIPMDNNVAERRLRDPVVGRKTYYGSGAIWSGELAAMLWSIFQTARLHGLNPRLYLEEYLNVCAKNGGKAPADIEKFLPWNLAEERKKALAEKLDSS